MRNELIITQNFEPIFEQIKQESSNKILKFFIFESFLIENSKEVISEAFLAESRQKFIIISAKNFTVEAQNSLLKIIEEPPNGVFFKIITDNKNRLLPTLRSRLQIFIRNSIYRPIQSGLNYRALTYVDILNFLQNRVVGKNEPNRFELKELLKNMLNDCFVQGVEFNLDELEYINELMILIELNTKAKSILTPFLMMILNKAKNR